MGRHGLIVTAGHTAGLLLPIAEYSHQEGNAIIGGYVYHGAAISGLQGTYVFGDLGTGKIWGLQEIGTNTWTRTLLATTGKNLTSFGQDQAGELYAVDLAGELLRLRAQ